MAKSFKSNIDVEGSLSVNDEVYGMGWVGSTQVPTKNAVYNRIEGLPSGDLEAVVITTSLYTLLEADIDAFKIFIIEDNIDTANVTITIPSTSLTGLQFINIRHEGGGNITIVPGVGVNAVQYLSSSDKNIVLASRTVNVWDLHSGEAIKSAVTVAVTGVTLIPNLMTIVVGEEFQLFGGVEPANATDQTATWASSNVNIATVDQFGWVTGIAEGQAIITFTSTDGAFQAQTEINVNPLAQTMADFGSIVSGYEASSVTGVQGDPIATWDDSYGVNNGTSTLSTGTILNYDDFDNKEINFNGTGMFNLGNPSDLDFVLTQESFTWVYHVGSFVNGAVIGEIYSKGAGATTTRQWSLTTHSDQKIRPSFGGATTFGLSIYEPNDVWVFSYDHLDGAQGTLRVYRNGTLQATNIFSTIEVRNNTSNICIGGRSDNGSFLNGSMKGFFIYNGSLDQTAVTNIQNHLIN